MVSEQEFRSIVERCAELPPAPEAYLESDYVTNLLLTVLDFMMHSHAVEKAMKHYKDVRWSLIRSFEDLQNLLAEYPDDKDGNTLVAQYLWGNNHWKRVSLLRGLVAYFGSIGVTSETALMNWAKRSDFRKDFQGKIPGLGFAVYQWLLMRQGVETIKPDVHVHRFVFSSIGRRLSDDEVVVLLKKVAKQIGVKAYELDWRIWEYQRTSR